MDQSDDFITMVGTYYSTRCTNVAKLAMISSIISVIGSSKEGKGKYLVLMGRVFYMYLKL